jgi:hypothetical protein
MQVKPWKLNKAMCISSALFVRPAIAFPNPRTFPKSDASKGISHQIFHMANNQMSEKACQALCEPLAELLVEGLTDQELVAGISRLLSW